MDSELQGVAKQFDACKEMTQNEFQVRENRLDELKTTLENQFEPYKNRFKAYENIQAK